MEKFKRPTTVERPALKERGLVTELSALRNDWLKANNVSLENKKASELKKEIDNFYMEAGPAIKNELEQKGLSLEGDLRQLAREHLDAGDLQKVRDQLELPKWVPLSEAVAFIKTAIDVGEGGVQEKYAQYCAETFSLDDMRSTLAFDNDVKPARIDTDIYNQTPERSRSAVEIVSNAIDALNPEQNSIGRFGVGFYQILAHLKDEQDFVEVKTGNEKGGFYNVSFRLKDKEIQVNLAQDPDASGKGTTVRLHSKDFPKDEADALIKKHFTYNDVAQVRANGEIVNDVEKFGIGYKDPASVSYESTDSGFAVRDEGVGMSPQVILEKLLVPKFSGKRSVHELAKEATVGGSFLVERRTEEKMHEQGKVVVNVGGVLIEEVPLTGTHTPKTLVINLPNFTTLGEERNEVAIDEVTIKSAKNIIDKIMATNDTELINAVAPLVESFQRRSLQHSKDANLVSYLRDRAEDILPKDAYYLPNAPGFDRLQLENTTLLDPTVKKTHWSHIPELTALSTRGDGKAVFVGPLSEQTDNPVIGWKNQIIFDSGLYEQYKNDPTMVNLYLQAHGKAEEIDIREIAGKQKTSKAENEGSQELKESYKDVADFVTHNWESIGFDSVNQARAYTKFEEAKLTPEVSQTLTELANAFPPAISSYFAGAALTGRMRSEEVEATKSFMSLAQNPDLVSSLAIAGIHGLHVERIEQEIFPQIDRDTRGKRRHLDSSLTKATGEDWYKVKYWNRENLIAENGKVYSGERPSVERYANSNAPSAPSPFAFGYIPLFDEASKKTSFLDPVTGELIDKTFLNTDSSARAFSFGGKRLYVTPKGAFDFDTGELAIIPKWDINVYNCNEDFLLIDQQWLMPDGKVLSSEEHDGFKKRQVLESNPEKPVAFSFEDRVELRMGDKLIYTKFRNAASKEDKEIYKYEELHGTVVESEGKKLIVERYRKNQYESHIKYGQSNEVEVRLLTPEGDTILAVESQNRLNPRTVDLSDGIKALQIEEYRNTYRAHHTSDVASDLVPKAVRYFNLEGQELFGEQLKAFPPLSVRLKASYERGLLSPYQSEAWHADVKTERGKNGLDNGYLEQYFELTDDRTKQPLLSGKFRSVVYDPVEDVWKCTYLEPAIIPISEDRLSVRERGVYKVAVINSEGVLLREEEAMIKSMYLETAYKWDGKMPLEGMQPVSYEKTVLMNRAIHAFDQADRESVERLVNRSLRFGALLSDDSFEKVVPALLQVKYMDERISTEERIKNISARLQEFDESSVVWCYRFLSQMLPPKAQDAEVDAAMEKFLLVYREKIAQLPDTEKQEIYDSFSQCRDYNGEYLATGWTIVQHKTPVPTAQIPEKIRAIVDFLNGDEAKNLTSSPERIEVSDQYQVTLAQLIQTKRLNESAVQNFKGSAQELEKVVQEKTRTKTQEHIRREIIHPIYYQSVNNPYLFIRELIQNGHDVAVKSTDENDKKVQFDVFSRQDNEVTVRIEDRGGMQLQDVVNYFLIPGESTKINDEESIGYFGQGVFTLFRDAKEVVMQTSVGDGTVSKLRIAPQRNESGMIVDLDIHIAQEPREFKGTIIEKTLNTTSATIEGAFIKNAASTYASLVDSNAVDISLNGRQLNKPQGKLAEVEVPGLGTFAMYDAPNNVVVQRGLFVKTVDGDFKTQMRDVEYFLERRGVVISIPDSIALTRSRNELARKQEFLPALQEYLPLLKISAYLEIFRQDIEKGQVIQLDNLPYDFYSESSSVSAKVLQDANVLRQGKPITDVSNYLESGKLVELLVHLPVVAIDDKTYTITELKRAALSGQAPLNDEKGWQKIPKVLQDKLRQGKERYNSSMESRRRDEAAHEKVEDFSLKDYAKQPAFVRDRIEKNLPAFEAMTAKLESLNQSLVQFNPLFGSTRNTYYSESEQSIAHAIPFLNTIGWNLDQLKEYQLAYFNKPDTPDSYLKSFYDTYSHECAHLLEKSNQFTHNRQFYRQQARTLSYLMQAKKREAAQG